MSVIRFLSLVMFMAAGLIGKSNADQVAYRFEGAVTGFIEWELPTAFESVVGWSPEVGDAISGTFSYNVDSVDSSQWPNVGYYDQATATAVNVQVADRTVASAFSTVEVFDNTTTPYLFSSRGATVRDSVNVIAYGHLTDVTNRPPGTFGSFFLSLASKSENYVSEDTIPISLSLDDFEDAIGAITYGITGGGFYYSVDLLEPIVPTPIGDLNGDQSVTAVDIDILAAHLQKLNRWEYDPRLDVLTDSRNDSADMDFLVTDILETSYGDANLDGLVGAADLNGLALNWQQNVASWSYGDFTGNGVVDSADLNALALNWQPAVRLASSAAPVPEPSGWLLMIVGLSMVRRRPRF